MARSGIIAGVFLIIILALMITTKDYRRIVTETHGTGFVTRERSFTYNQIINYFGLCSLPIINDYCWRPGEFLGKYSTRYYTQGIDPEWQAYENMKAITVEYCRANNIRIQSIVYLIKHGDLRNIETDDEMYQLSRYAECDFIAGIRYWESDHSAEVSVVKMGNYIIGKSSYFIPQKAAQQVDSAEASTIAVPPSEPSGSPR